MTIPWSECQHSRKEHRRRKNSAGKNYYVLQCLDCGSSCTGQISPAKVPEIWKVRDFDDALFDASRAANDKLWQNRQDRQSREWWDAYTDYIRWSPLWQAKRKAVLERDGHRCKACMTDCRGIASEVHHLTYKNLFNEPLFDLISICTQCHNSLHQQRGEKAA